MFVHSFSYCLIRQLGFRLGVPLAALLSSVAIEFYASVSFTICAPLLAASGAILFVKGCIRKNVVVCCRWYFASSGRNVALPDVSIGDSVFGSLAFVGAFPVQGCTENVDRSHFCGLAIYGVNTFDENLYNDPEYKYYKAYQYKRSFLAMVLITTKRLYLTNSKNAG